MQSEEVEDSREHLPDLLERARNGCPQATQLLYERYSSPVRKVIRKHLDHRARRQFDSHDVLQSVWREFFTEVLFREAFATPESFLAFMLSMAKHKTLDVNRRVLDTQKRNASLEVSLDTEPAVEPPDRRSFLWRVELEDEWQWLLAFFGPHEQRGLTLLREGYPVKEVASLLGMPAHWVYRLVQRARACLSEP